VQDHGVLSTIKHFILNNQENGRNFYNSIADERTLWEVYYPSYEASVEVDVASVMCSYNRVDGVYACEQGDILNQDLKGTMGFEGWVMSDWWATKSTDAANHGLDQEQPGSRENFFAADLLESGVEMDTLNTMVARVLTPILHFGIKSDCTPPNCDALLYETVATSEEHQVLARELAAESAALLKNDGVLPLDPANVQTVAVVGSACDAPNRVTNLFWNTGSYYVVGGSGRVLSRRAVSIVSGLRLRAEEAGMRLVESLSDDVDSALSAAAQAGVVIVCGATTSSEDRDRANLYVDQEAFIAAFLAQSTETPSVVALTTPGAVLTEWKDNANAIFNMFLAGEATGLAYADVLFGDVNPSGKLPVTFPDTVAQTVEPCGNFGDCRYSEGLGIGYRGLTETVSFPFGHGLSYTQFEYSNLQIAPCVEQVSGPREMCASVDVKNVGVRDGAEVVQLYLSYPTVFMEPPIVLRGFAKQHIFAGDTFTAMFTLKEKDLSMWDTRVHDWRVCGGEWEVHAGTSSQDLRAHVSFEVNGDILLPPRPDFPGEDDDDYGAIDFEEFPGTGCVNWEDITISSEPVGQGNCQSFCAVEEACAAYNVGVSGEREGYCSLYVEGCQQQPGAEWDLFIRL
jgi:beta-glucosidase